MASSSKMYGVSFFLMMAFFGAAAMAKEVHVNWAADVDYAAWAANTTIVIGDQLYFDYLRDSEDDVEQVSEQCFNDCIDGPYVKGHWIGDNAIELSESGTYYFINDFPGKCESGWKLQFHVLTKKEAAAKLRPPPTRPFFPVSPQTSLPSPGVMPPCRSGAAPSTLISLSTLTFPLCLFIFSLFL